MDTDKTLEAIWAVDSETGEELLIDLKTSKIIARRDHNGNITGDLTCEHAN